MSTSSAPASAGSSQGASSLAPFPVVLTPWASGLPTKPMNHITVTPSGTLYGSWTDAMYVSAGVVQSVDSGATWSPLPSIVADRFASLCADAGPADMIWGTPEAIYGGARRGPYSSTQGGPWVAAPLPGNVVATGIACHPTVPGLIIATSSDAIYRSTDAGVTWTQVESRQLYVSGPVFAPGGRAYAQASFALWGSTDDGATWAAVPSSSFPLKVAPHPGVGGSLFGVVGRTVVHSADHGLTWQGGTAQAHDIVALGVDPEASGTVYALVDGVGVRRSTDNAATFTTVGAGIPFATIETTAWAAASGAFAFPGGGKVIASSWVGTYASVDGGATWSPSEAGITTHHLAGFHPAPGVFLVATFGATAGRVWRTTSAVTPWFNTGLAVPTGGVLFGGNPADPAVFYAQTTSGLFRSADSGVSFGAVNTALSWVTSVAVSWQDANTLYLASSDTGVMKSTDGGQTFAPANEGLGAVARAGVQRIWASPHAAGTLFTCNDDGFFRTNDAAATWTRLATIGLASLSFHPAEAGTLLGHKSWDDYDLAMSSDGGTTWTPLPYFNSPLHIDLATWDPYQADVMWVVHGAHGLFRSPDRGASWAKVTGDPAVDDVAALSAGPDGSLLAATTNHGVKTLTVP